MTPNSQSGEPSRKLKWTIALSFAIILIGTSVVLALGGPTGIANHPGLFGTKANLFSDLNLIAQFILLTGLSLGVVLARRGKIAAHQYNQTGWVLLNIVLTIFIMIVAYVEYVLPDFQKNLGQAFGLVSTLHAILGSVAIVCGVYLILRMNHLLPAKWRIKGWKRLMRWTFALYLAVGLLGLGIYYFWFMR